MAAGRPVGPHQAGGHEFPADRYDNVMAFPAAIWLYYETNVAMAMGVGRGMAGVTVCTLEIITPI